MSFPTLKRDLLHSPVSFSLCEKRPMHVKRDLNTLYKQISILRISFQEISLALGCEGSKELFPRLNPVFQMTTPARFVSMLQSLPEKTLNLNFESDLLGCFLYFFFWVCFVC